MQRRRVVIMGAAGRDFHNFNVLFRDQPEFEVVAFTATQIPDIDGPSIRRARRGALSARDPDLRRGGARRPGPRRRDRRGVVLLLRRLVPVRDGQGRPRRRVGCALRHPLGRPARWSRSTKPVIAIAAVRTGVGKSQTTRYVSSDPQASSASGSSRSATRCRTATSRKQVVPALRDLRGPRQARVHHRGARGVRAAHRQRLRRLRRRRLRDDPARGREGSRRHPVGRRQQRHAVLQARPASSRSSTRTAPATS